MWALDLPTLVLVIAAALYVGLLGAFNFDAINYVLGSDGAFWLKCAMGFAGLWQLTRQRFT